MLRAFKKELLLCTMKLEAGGLKLALIRCRQVPQPLEIPQFHVSAIDTLPLFTP